MMLSREGLLLRLSAVQWGVLSQRLIPWLNVLLLLLLAYAAAGISWRLWPQSPVSHEIHLLADSTNLSSPASQVGAGLVAVAAMHLFGEADAAVPAPVASVIEAPETRLSLTLRGIVSLSAGSEGRALIAEGSAEEKVYKVGDALSGGALLHEVLSDRVILQRGGRFETLTLPRERAAFAEQPAPHPGKAALSATSGRADAGIGQQLRTLRDVVVNDPQQAFSLVQTQPVMEGGVVKGYRVSPGKERRLFHGSGLRPGDVVTSVNGVALSDTAQLATLYAQFKSADRFELVVERGGRPTSLTIDLGK